MIRKTVEIATAGTRLSISHRQLVIERPNEVTRTLPCEDIGVLIVDHPQVTYTHSVFTALIESGAAVLLCGPDHLPAGILLPFHAHTTQTQRHRAQAEASDGLKRRAWQQLVAAKLQQQAVVLVHFSGADGGLSEMARRVRPGDPENLEAMGAQRYWPRLFGPNFRRSRDGLPPNNLLNYGYAILRAGIARAIAGAGLMPTLGVHHRNRGNPFCLADDLLEPYRPFVDWRVKGMLVDGPTPTELDRPTKAALLSLLNETVVVGDRRLPLMLAFHASAASLCRLLTHRGRELVLPDGLPVAAPDVELRETEDG